MYPVPQQPRHAVQDSDGRKPRYDRRVRSEALHRHRGRRGQQRRRRPRRRPPGYAMEAQRMSWPQSSNYRQAEMLAGSFAQICKSILKKNVSSRIIAVIDDHLTASESFFYSRLNNSLPTELAQSTAYSFNRYGSGKYPAVFNGSDADNTNVLQCGGSLYRFTFLGGKRRICFKAVFCCRASNIGF